MVPDSGDPKPLEPEHIALAMQSIPSALTTTAPGRSQSPCKPLTHQPSRVPHYNHRLYSPQHRSNQGQSCTAPLWKPQAFFRLGGVVSVACDNCLAAVIHLSVGDDVFFYLWGDVDAWPQTARASPTPAREALYPTRGRANQLDGNPKLSIVSRCS